MRISVPIVAFIAVIGASALFIMNVLARGGTLPMSPPGERFSERSEPERRVFADTFERTELIRESGSISESGDPNWWVNSGAYAYVKNGVLETVQGRLPKDDTRRIDYADTNADESDNGYRPQNIFRMVTRETWSNFEQRAYFNVKHYNESASPHRYESNAMLLLSRYVNSDNLYYAGVRVDGFAVIKKKVNGDYYTMAEKRVFPGSYDRRSNPNLIPIDAWIGLKSLVRTESDGSVRITLETDIGKTGTWTPVLDASDDGSLYGGPPIRDAGHAGIRTDFMDAQFADYEIVEQNE